MSQTGCADCAMRKKYDQNPGSFWAKVWKWHIKWCPGWKQYLASLDERERESIKHRYR